MKKLFILPAQEDWICDRFVSEYSKFIDGRVILTSPNDADIIWLLSDWCWNKLDINLLEAKKILCTVHHIVPEKFSEAYKQEFLLRDRYVDVYHTPCKKTAEQISRYTNKRIVSFPFWVNNNIFYPIDKFKFNKEEGVLYIGSFQRDTEGSDLRSPKLEKGPDLFCNYVIDLAQERKVKVILCGWRRQYVIERLKNAGIDYYYHELPDFKTLNDYYNLIDVYITLSRYEGGPQSVFEASATKTAIISGDAGYATELLCKGSLLSQGATIDTAFASIEKNYKRVSELFMEKQMKKFQDLMENI